MGGGRQGADALEGVGMLVGCASGIASIVMIVLGIMFWVRVSNLGGQLAATPGTYPGEYRGDLGDYDRPFRPGDAPPPGPAGPPDSYRPDEPGQYQ